MPDLYVGGAADILKKPTCYAHVFDPPTPDGFRFPCQKKEHKMKDLVFTQNGQVPVCRVRMSGVYSSVPHECADKKIPPVVRRDRSSEPVAQNPPGECSHCRYLSIASGSKAVHSMGHPIRRSTSETVGHKSIRISI